MVTVLCVSCMLCPFLKNTAPEYNMLPSQPEKLLTQRLYFSDLFLEHLMKLSMEELVEFLQETLAKDFFFEDDFVIEQLQISMVELKRAKLDLPEPGKKSSNTF